MQVPDAVFDFHGYTTLECKDELNQIIASGEYSHIRVIVGKGRGSLNGPILPNFVKNFLTEKRIRFAQSKFQDGGEGAIEVYL